MARRATKNRRMSHRKKSHRMHREGGEKPGEKPGETPGLLRDNDDAKYIMSNFSEKEGEEGEKGGQKYEGGRKCRNGKKSKRGGSTMAQGAWPWVSANFGSSTEQQFMNTFGNGGRGNAGALIPTVAGAPGVLNYNKPQGSSLALNNGPRAGSQHGGKRRHRGVRSKKGGYWAQVIEQALVPFGLLGLQNVYANRTRKHRNK